MNPSAGVAGCRLTFDLDLDGILPCEKVEPRRSHVVHELNVPALLHEMGRYGDLISKRSRAICAVDGIAQPAFERIPHVVRERFVNTLCGEKKTVEIMVLVAFRKSSGIPAVFSGLGQCEFQRVVFAEMRSQQRIGPLLALEGGHALVYGGPNQPASPIEARSNMFRKRCRA